jgi:hypothetical protein
MNFRDVPIPRRMRALQRDRRGYPIPFIVLRDLKNKPHFTVNDTVRTERCLKENRCAICGNRLDREMWFVGGPASAFHPDGAYIDTPLHAECKEYALQVCPYLAAPRYAGRIDASTVDLDQLRHGQILVDHTMCPERPLPFVAVCSRGMEIRPHYAASVPCKLCVPSRPYSAIEFWEQGARLDPVEGMRLAMVHMANVVKQIA